MGRCVYCWVGHKNLVGGLEPWNFMIFHILGIIIPTDELIFFRGLETNQKIIGFLWGFNCKTCGDIPHD